LIKTLKALFDLNDGDDLIQVDAHEGGRNTVFVCKRNDLPEYVIRVSATGDRIEEEYLAETEFVHYLAENGADVADVIPSVNGKTVEKLRIDGKEAFVSCFEFAPGMLISDNGYRYREGHPFSEYFYNTGKTLGRIHRLSKQYRAESRRQDYFDKYNVEYIDGLFAGKYPELRDAIERRLERFLTLSKSREEYGLVHFDFSDGNYHVDMTTGKITVFDFDNCIRCWYMFDLANLWTHGTGWFMFEDDKEKRRAGMQKYFDTIIEGYRSETGVSDEMLSKLPLFIDMVLIENIVDEFECCIRAGIEVDYEDVEDAACCLTGDIPYAGFV